VKSSARRLGANARWGVLGFYIASFVMVVASATVADLGPLFLPPVALFAVHLSRQAARLDVSDGAGALVLFKSNAVAGLILAVAFAVGVWKPAAGF
jgi:4-hydroxybenzoate polyprenyltransferase